MKFFNIDLHISVIADIKRIMGGLGHTVVDQSLSGHTWVFNRNPDTNRIVSQDNWRFLDKSMCDKFYAEYKNELASYDAFIVTYPPIFSLLYEKFNKPIIVVAPIRLETAFENNEKLVWFVDFLKRGIDNKLIVPIANSKYDKMNCEKLTNREWTHIPNICDYTNLKYKKNNRQFLLCSRKEMSGVNFIWKEKTRLQHRYNWESLNEFGGIVHMPYNVSIMSIFEQYTAGFPLIFPSLDYAYDNWEKLGLFSELGNVKNNCSKSDIALSDFYDVEYMPHISYFDDNNSLENIINRVDRESISKKMNIFNIERKERIINKWKEALKKC